MSRTRRASFLAKATVAILVLGLVASGCARTETDEPGVAEEPNTGNPLFVNGMINEQEAPAEPTEGGQLNFATFSEARSLDPVRTLNTGSTGGTEMAAVYDVLLRHNDDTLEYEPWLAESFETEDNVTWVLTLQEGITFSDGTALDAEAVVWSINRYVEGGGGQSGVWKLSVDSVEATGPLEVTFTLQRPWSGFGYLLATAPGMIVAPTSQNGEEFTPIGAGPFTFDHYSPNEELVLVRRDDYWGGTPHLESLRFFNLTAASGRLETVQGGQADMAYLREPPEVTTAIEEGFQGFMEVSALGRLILINHRETANTADVRIRLAMAHAIDPQFIDERENNGTGVPTTAMFPPQSEWALETAPVPYDPEEARRLVEEAKADGHPGVVRFAHVQGAGDDFPLALKGQLEAVGLQVELEYAASVTDLVQDVYVTGDFDMTIWSFGVPDGGVLPEMYESFHSAGGGPNKYVDAEMDELVIELMEAIEPADQKAVLERIQQRYNETIPSISVAATPEFVLWQQDLHGVVTTIDSVVLLGDAFKAN